jgi:predicted 3-demethylubiquinone-9 3-methyltransferase (glyoxalase superfamily)
MHSPVQRKIRRAGGHAQGGRRHLMTARKQTSAPRITPFLWFDGKAAEAAKFYTAIFKDSKIISVSPMSATFELAGQKFMALNGGPQFKFTEAISFFVSCDTQDEIDYYWGKLSAGGQPGRCGWLKDQFGVSWQIIPPILGDLLYDDDEEKSQRVMKAMMQMRKLDIRKLKVAHAGK